MMMSETKNTKILIVLHLAVFLAGWTGVFGRLITMGGLPLVWYRMAVSVVFTRNEGSTALMRKFGFTRFGVLPGGVVNDGVALDVAYWYKNLV